MWRATTLSLACAIVWSALPAPVRACSIPVFRYALEHWQPDDFVLRIVTAEPLPPSWLDRLHRLSDPDADGRPGLNLRIETVDATALPEDDALRAALQREPQGVGYAALSRPARGTQPAEVVWSGLLTEENLTELAGSPLRESIGKQLLEGESVVWVLLESGDPAVDDPAWTTLTTELARLQVQLKLPPIDPADAAELTVAPESLKLSFAAHRLSRSDAAERVVIESLLTVEPDLRDAALQHEPMAFPIFGRGRVLYALVGAGINAGTIEEAGRFLTAGCQCTVKQQNPGADLLLPVAWARFVEPTTKLKTAPPLVGVQSFGLPEPGDVPDPVTLQTPQPTASAAPAAAAAAPAIAPLPSAAPLSPAALEATAPPPWLTSVWLTLAAILGCVVAGAVWMAATRR